MEFETVRRERAGENFCPRGVAGGTLPGNIAHEWCGKYRRYRAHISHLTGTRGEVSPRPKLGAGLSNSSSYLP